MVVAVPDVLVNTARYWYPLLAAGGVVMVRVGETFPARLLKVSPPSVLTCHWTVGAGVPLAAAVKVAFCPGKSLAFTGCRVIAGASAAEVISVISGAGLKFCVACLVVMDDAIGRTAGHGESRSGIAATSRSIISNFKARAAGGSDSERVVLIGSHRGVYGDGDGLAGEGDSEIRTGKEGNRVVCSTASVPCPIGYTPTVSPCGAGQGAIQHIAAKKRRVGGIGQSWVIAAVRFAFGFSGNGDIAPVDHAGGNRSEGHGVVGPAVAVVDRSGRGKRLTRSDVLVVECLRPVRCISTAQRGETVGTPLELVVPS